MQKNRDFFDVYRQADFVTVDSQIVYWAAKFLGHPVKEKVSGSDFFPAYYDFHKNNPSIRIFLLGGGPGIARQAARNVNAKAGREIVTGDHFPMALGAALDFEAGTVSRAQRLGLYKPPFSNNQQPL